jgi:uncharacterized integral membrane protein
MTLRNIKITAIAIVSVLVLIVIFQNWEPVETDLLFFSLQMPRTILLLGTTLVGFVVGILTAYFLMKGEKPPR